MKMKAAVLREWGAPFTVEELDLSGPAPGEVLVKMTACGVCHSDIHQAKGEWQGIDIPIVIGHEGAGIVDQVGEGVTSVAPGDHVVLGWQTSCGECDYCMTGALHLCDNPPGLAPSTQLSTGDESINFSWTTAYYAQYAVVPASVAIPIREEMPLDKASLLACAVTTGVGAAVNTAQVRPGTTVAVYGCGGVGLNVIQGAALCGAARIIGVDLVDEKLEFAKRFGLTDAVNAGAADPVEAIKDLTDGAGAHYAFEAIGNVHTMEQTFASIRKGGTAVVVGMPAYREEARLSLPVMDFFGDRWVTAAYYGSANLWRDIPRFVDLYLGGKLNLDDIVARQYPLEGINQAFEDILAGKPGKGVIVFE